MSFGKFMLGTAVLGLLVIWGFGWEGNRETPGESTESGGNRSTADPGTPLQPEWQANPNPAGPVNLLSNPGIARPVFPDPGRNSGPPASLTNHSPAGASPLPVLPQAAQHYNPLQTLAVGNPDGPNASLVPVQPPAGFPAGEGPTRTLHVVRPGESLQSIASQHYGSAARYLDIYHANRHLLGDPSRLSTGIELRIPE